MKRKSIIFYNNKFGIILDIKENSTSVYFEDDTKMNLLYDYILKSKDVVIISDLFRDKIINDNYRSLYDSYTWEMGLNYYNKEKVLGFKNKNKRISSIVGGRGQYFVNITLKNNLRCSCLASPMCKHEVATILTLKDKFDYLLDRYVQEKVKGIRYQVSPLIDKSNESTFYLFDIKDSDFINTFAPFKFIEVYSALSDLDLAAKIRIIEALEAFASTEESKKITISYLLSFYMFNSLNEYIEIIKSDSLKIGDIKYKNLNSICNIIKNRWPFERDNSCYLKNKEFTIYYYLINKSYIDLINYYFNNFGNTVKYIEYLKYALTHIESADLDKNVSHIVMNDRTHVDNIALLLSKLNKENKIKIILKHPKVLLEYDIKLDLKSLIYIAKFTNKYKFEIISLYKDILKEEPKELMSLLFYCYKKELASYQDIIEIARSLPKSKYACLLFSENKFIREERIGLESESYSQRLTKYYSDIDLEELFFYFDLDYESYSDEYDDVYIDINLMFNGYCYVSVLYDFKNLDLATNPNFEGFNIANFIYDYVLEHHKEVYQSAVNQRKQIEENRKRYIRVQFERGFDRFNYQLQLNQETTIDLKATLQVYIDRRFNRFKFNFKIGSINSDVYSDIKIAEFLSHFKYEDIIKYNDSLTFRHRLENIASPYDELIRYYLEIPQIEEADETKIKINPRYVYPKIFNILNNTYVFVNYIKTYVNLVAVKLEYYIDERYILHLNYSTDDIWIFKDMILVNNLERNEINKLDIDLQEEPLFYFFKNFNGMSIEFVIDEFKNTIYPKYKDKIIINDKIKDKFGN